jgi:oxaloacetate decarboxylase gamma subunit
MSELLSQGLNLALYGMGTVFVFLTLLVGATILMSSLVAVPPESPEELEIDPGVFAAIGAAVRLYRSRH